MKRAGKSILVWTIVKVALKSLLANRMRSFLAMLGIIIGVGGVISMMAVTTGTTKATLDFFARMGTRQLVIYPTARSYGGVASGTQQNLTVADAKALLNETTKVERVTPFVNRGAQVKCMGRNTSTQIVGAAPTYLAIGGFEIDAGRGFTDQETDRMARVAVIGPTTAENLFAADDPVGQVVKIAGINFTVVGVLKAKGSMWGNPDDQIIVPFTTAMKQLVGRGSVRADSLGRINVQITADADPDEAADEVKRVLRKRHQIAGEDNDDFNVRNQAEFIENQKRQARIFTVLLASIASIALLVGGIGIMNIMLVSVTERTREIGVRKAIGAKEGSILWQFLVESIVICGVGGLLGVGAGILAAHLIGTNVPDLPTRIELGSILLSLSFSGMVGIIFGMYPAWRAARLDPVDALRYE